GRDARAAAGRRGVRAPPPRAAGGDMPAGTVLRLATPGELSSFDRARFPDGQPGLVHGLESAGLYRYAATTRQPETLSVEIARDQAQEGWLCAHGHRVEFVMMGGQPRFASCHLAIGNQLDGQPVPPGTWIQVDPAVRGQPIEQAGAGTGARWLLRTEGSEPMDVEKLSLLKLELRLDARRQLLGFEGLLSRETTLGEMTYPAGTRVLSGGLRAAGAQPGDLLFSASRGRVARRAGGTDVAAGSSVLQAPDGAVRAVLSNRDAGVLDVAAVRVGP
ncbi:hypothetical protein KDH83_29675, partial [Achromobacter sp. Marseille-Q0513]|uniref:hypothetical protein n=1 Tax=Achromobacter sp. Marseille-Q0513 TaxID=2829161 RepID=UPI001B93FAC3